MNPGIPNVEEKFCISTKPVNNLDKIPLLQFLFSVWGAGHLQPTSIQSDPQAYTL